MTVQKGWKTFLSALLFWVYFVTKSGRTGVFWALLNGKLTTYSFATFKLAMGWSNKKD